MLPVIFGASPRGGREIWIQAAYNPIRRIHGKVVKVVKFATDITSAVIARNEAARVQNMMDNMPINVIMANREGELVYFNPTAMKTLKKLERLLPKPVEQLKGQKYDIFHKHPEMQRRLLSEPKNLPHKAKIQLGGETLDLLVSANNGLLLIAEGTVISPQLKMKLKVRRMDRIQISAADAAVVTLGSDLGDDTGGGISFDTELTRKLDELIESGSMFLDDTGGPVRDKVVLHGCKAYDPTVVRRLSIRSEVTCEGPRVSVVDSGGGLDTQVAEKLFHPFQSTKSTGLGLGLAISRTLIEAHDGRIEAVSQP